MKSLIFNLQTNWFAERQPENWNGVKCTDLPQKNIHSLKKKMNGLRLDFYVKILVDLLYLALIKSSLITHLFNENTHFFLYPQKLMFLKYLMSISFQNEI